MSQSPTPEQLQNVRHSFAHLLAAGVLQLWPDTKTTIGPAIDNGFYYDFEFAKPLTEHDLPKLEGVMRDILKTWKGFSHREVSEAEARSTFAHNPYKLELIDDIVARGETITLYRAGDFEDLCRGGHAEDIKSLKPDAFVLTHVAGAYWRGDEKRQMLTRIYGLAFENKERLEEYRTMQEEAKKRDHRKLGKELDLFVFSDLVGSGMPLFTPRGNFVRSSIVNYSRELNEKLGFSEVHTPNINKAELFKISGHYDKYKEDMLTVHSQYSVEEFFLKPMNCPQHTQLFASRPRSYRDLPIRYSDFATLYRDERPGELSGLTRLRSFAQDDGHIFCREDQIEDELSAVLEAIQTALETYHIDYWMRLSLRDPQHTEKYLGSDTVWEHSQSIMATLLKEKNITHKAVEGEAAFYGPKIDIMAVDAIGREWQISTVQLDFNIPNRFELTYVDKDGQEKRPVMIHRALIGSPDRFLGILIEHYAGAFPLWLSPEQIRVLPISDAHHAFADEVYRQLKSAGLRVELNLDSDTLGKKIRDAKVAKVPYLAVIGEKEVTAQAVTLEGRAGNLGQLSIQQMIEKLQKEIQERA